MDLALFDFDGTVTSAPTYPAFVRFAVRRHRKLLGGLVLLPVLLCYRLGIVPDRRVRKAISPVAFWREDPERLRALGARYAEEVLPRVIRQHAIERINWHRARGDRVVVVSASLDVYLKPWCERIGIEAVCSELEVVGERVTGRYVVDDCCGAEKSRRIQERFALSDYAAIYAYGDTEEDRQMLEMATRKFFRWEEVGDLPAASP
jgi:HAD superfamily hydrolase (TIGR01490 family)